MSTDIITTTGWRGHVVQTSKTRGVIWEGHNLVVNLAPEVMLAALMGTTSISKVAFGYGGGRPVTPSTRSIPGVVFSATPTTKTVGRDKNNRRTLGTWRFTWTPTAAIRPSMS